MIGIAILLSLTGFAVAFLPNPTIVSSVVDPFNIQPEALPDLPEAHPDVLAALNDWHMQNRFGMQPSVTTLNLNFSTPTPPCCSDGISSTACKRLQANNPVAFEQRCERDPDFSHVQCCQTCGVENAEERYSKFFDQNSQSSHCFDRHSTEFCVRFLHKNDFWGRSSFSCDGHFASIAFRICRKTCNFCNRHIYRTADGGKYKVTSCGKPNIIVRD